MRAIVILLSLFYCLSVFSQEEAKKTMNEIKLNSSYLYAEATDDTKDLAFNTALGEFVYDASKEVNAELSAESVKGVVKSLEIQRGECVQMFLYALKSDIKELAASNPQPVHTQQTQPEKTPTTRIGFNIQPEIVEQPQPQVVEQQQQVVAQSQPQTVEQPAQQNSSTQTVTTANPSKLLSATSVFSRMNTFTEIKSLLRDYKESGKISDYGPVRSLSLDPDACIIIIRGESIVAVLQQEKDNKRINYMTDAEDSITNYSGCQAVWYK